MERSHPLTQKDPRNPGRISYAAEILKETSEIALLAQTVGSISLIAEEIKRLFIKADFIRGWGRRGSLAEGHG